MEINWVVYMFNFMIIEMDQWYNLLKKVVVCNIWEYNEKFVQCWLNLNKGYWFMLFIVLVIDEFVDMIMMVGKEVELLIGCLVQFVCVVGIYLIIVIQCLLVNIIIGVIKVNFLVWIVYKVFFKVDFWMIFDVGGADQLIGQGDMLLLVGGEMVCLQGVFVDILEVEWVIDFIVDQWGYLEFYYLFEFYGDDEEIEGFVGLIYVDLDEMFEDVVCLIV